MEVKKLDSESGGRIKVCGDQMIGTGMLLIFLLFRFCCGSPFIFQNPIFKLDFFKKTSMSSPINQKACASECFAEALRGDKRSWSLFTPCDNEWKINCDRPADGRRFIKPTAIAERERIKQRWRKGICSSSSFRPKLTPLWYALEKCVERYTVSYTTLIHHFVTNAAKRGECMRVSMLWFGRPSSFNRYWWFDLQWLRMSAVPSMYALAQFRA